MLLLMGLGEARAVGFCDCCAASPVKACAALCTPPAAPPQCAVVVDYKGRGGTVKGVNPLTGLTLREIALGEPSAGKLEKLRRFLERNRRRAVRDYDRALRSARYRRIDKPALERRGRLYREALVNYYHGIRAYLVRVGRKPD